MSETDIDLTARIALRDGLIVQLKKVAELQKRIDAAKRDLQALSNSLTMAIGARTFAAELLFGPDVDLGEAFREDREGIRTGDNTRVTDGDAEEV